MKDMFSKFKFAFVGICGFIIGGLTIGIAAGDWVTALQNTGITVNLNGVVQEFKDETTGERQFPLTYHDRTYLPLRNVAQLSGLNVEYEVKNNTAYLNYDKFEFSKILERCKHAACRDFAIFNFKANNDDFYYLCLGEGIARGEFYDKNNFQCGEINEPHGFYGPFKSSDGTVYYYAYNVNEEDVGTNTVLYKVDVHYSTEGKIVKDYVKVDLIPESELKVKFADAKIFTVVE